VIDDVLAVHRRELGRCVAQLAALCRIPSVGGDDAAMEETVRWIVAAMREAGITADVLPGEGNHPYIVGEARGDGARTLLFFNHYDIANYTHPVEARPGERPPFSGAVEEGRIYGRGVADDKATLLSRIHAVRTWRRARGRLPVTVRFLFEGKRTLTTGALARFLERHIGRVRADACCWEAGAKDEADRPLITLGHKGQLFVELRCRTANADYPSRLTALPNAAWRLTWALASIKSPEERVALPGFYDDVRPITETEERAFYRHLAADTEGLQARTGVRAFVRGLRGQAVMRFLYSEPTATICGVEAGYVGPGHRLVSPGRARAHLELRLVPDQDPDRIRAALRAHLDACGFADVEMDVLASHPPHSLPADHPLVAVVAEAARAAYGVEPVIVPFATGMGSRYVFRRHTSMPIVGFAVGYAGAQLETNEEHIRIRDYEEGMRHILHLLARADRIPALEER
jgi:acetylornithine deacetylase/succinyl-diaminopimelate desuccinylase-like protein